MKKELFRIEPLRHYSRARYGSESGQSLIGSACWLLWRFPSRLVKGAATLLLVAGLALTSVSCGEPDTIDSDNNHSTDGDGDQEACTLGDLSCSDEQTMRECQAQDEGLAYVAMACSQYCENRYGLGSVSAGCDEAREDNICTCTDSDGDMAEDDYNLDGGDPPMCMLGDLRCDDIQTIGVCSGDYQDFRSMSCEQYCQEQFGVGSATNTCDLMNVENICGCLTPDGDTDGETADGDGTDADVSDGDADGDTGGESESESLEAEGDLTP